MLSRKPDVPPTSLLRVLGLLFGVAVSIGGTLGVGILRQPGPVADDEKGDGFQLAAAVQPAGDRDALADVLGQLGGQYS